MAVPDLPYINPLSLACTLSGIVRNYLTDGKCRHDNNYEPEYSLQVADLEP